MLYASSLKLKHFARYEVRDRFGTGTEAEKGERRSDEQKKNEEAAKSLLAKAFGKKKKDTDEETKINQERFGYQEDYARDMRV